MLANLTLKICLNSQPAREGMLQLNDWLNNDKINGAEIHAINADKDSIFGLSERLQINTIGQETFRYGLMINSNFTLKKYF